MDYLGVYPMTRKRGGRIITQDLKFVTRFMIIAVVWTMLVQIPFLGTYVPEGQTTGGPAPGAGGGPLLTDIDVLSRSRFTNEGQTSDEAFELPYTLVTMVEVNLTWVDDIGDNDVFRLTVSLSDEEMATDEGSSGQLSVLLNDDEGLLAGNYTVSITAVDCPGRISPIPIDRDNGNSWELDVKATVSEEGGGG